MKKAKLKPEVIKEKLIKLKAQFDKDALLYLILLLAGVTFGLSRLIFPAVSELSENFKLFMSKKESIDSMQKKIEMTKQLQQRKELEKQVLKLPVKIYKPPYQSAQLENASAGLINQIINIIKQSGPNKILSLEFEKKPVQDRYNVTSKNHSLLRIKLELESSYEVIQTILNEIYLINYLIKIDTVSLSSLKKYNYKRVQAYIVLDLFVDTAP